MPELLLARTTLASSSSAKSLLPWRGGRSSTGSACPAGDP